MQAPTPVKTCILYTSGCVLLIEQCCYGAMRKGGVKVTEGFGRRWKLLESMSLGVCVRERKRRRVRGGREKGKSKLRERERVRKCRLLLLSLFEQSCSFTGVITPREPDIIPY